MKRVVLVLMVTVFTFFINANANESEYEKNGWIAHSDVKGSKDSSLISRFKGSIIQYYKVQKWDKYLLPVSKIENMGGTKGWKKKLKLAGEVTRIQYSTSKKNNPALVAQNYMDALKKADWEILFSGCGENELGDSSYEWSYYYYGSDGLGLDKFGQKFDPYGKSHCYIAAKYASSKNTTYAAIYISDKVEDAKGLHFTLITQDITKVKNPDLGLVTAKLLTDKINSKGHLALDGIYFKTGKATLSKKSHAALKNIAKYLKTNKKTKFFIVGHTDNVRRFSSNMKLSKNRAAAVKNALVKKYGVSSKQLKAYGVANLCPVISNDSDEGRARNRRVEIVKQ